MARNHHLRRSPEGFCFRLQTQLWQLCDLNLGPWCCGLGTLWQVQRSTWVVWGWMMLLHPVWTQTMNHGLCIIINTIMIKENVMLLSSGTSSFLYCPRGWLRAQNCLCMTPRSCDNLELAEVVIGLLGGKCFSPHLRNWLKQGNGQSSVGDA